MHRLTWTLGLILLCAGRAAADDSPRVGQALALQEAFQQAIQEAQPSVACVLVSRSDGYQHWFGQTVLADNPGKLGGFDPSRVVIHNENDPQFREAHRHLEKKSRDLFGHLNYPYIKREQVRAFDLSDPANVPQLYGSGVVIGERGLILTNYHVVRDATKVYVRLPGGKGSYADIHAADPRSDLAVLKLLDADLNPRPIRRGDGGKLRKGQLVLSLANPYAAGYKDGSPSASWGIISNIRRRDPGVSWWEQDRAKYTLHQFGTLIQADARLNLGCSGGALIDLKGRLVGLTTALAALSGSETAGGYAFPLDDFLTRVIDVLARGEEVEYGFLGVGFQPEAMAGGTPRVSVVHGSPADRAGLKSGEVILSVNDTLVHEADDLFLTVGRQLAGAEVRLEVQSRSGQRTLAVRLAKYYVPTKFIAANRPAAVRGLRVDYASVLVQRGRNPAGIPPGVVVREVRTGSPADAALIQDALITHVNGQAVNTPAEFYRAAAKVIGPLELTVLDRSTSGGVRKVRLD
jgi:S1-C subfamily serine protease